jgi:hypothetical protein
MLKEISSQIFKMDEPDVLKELRSLILSKTGIRNITPADCKTISIEISKTLNKNVSETTIKRLFGFAMVRHNFSRFTLTTLSEYVNDQNLNTVIGNADNENQFYGNNWQEVGEKARRITDFTVKSIKNRSGIPYELTVSRKFSEHDFEDFYKSDHSYMAFISQPGYGKTIILAQLAESILASKTIAAQGTTLVFITAYNLLGKDNTQINFESHLKNLLGISPGETLIAFVNRHCHQNESKLLIFLDGFSEVMLKRDAQNLLFDGIIDFICSIENSNAIKLVMNMRSTTWSRFYDRVRNSVFLKKKWFQGNYFNLNDSSNVPPLTVKEVDLIIKKIDHLNHKNVNPRLKSQLKFPIHIQLYYQLKQEDPNFNYSTNITFYELIARFIQDKIYKSNYYTEKILFLKKVVQLTDLGKKQISVSKDDLIGELSAFKNAYSDLLSDGILMEERLLDSYHPKEYVRFIQPQVFEYFLFIELLEKFELRIEEEYFLYINQEYTNNHLKFHILQWTIRFMVRTGNFQYLHKVFQIEFSRYEKNYLILFIAENIDYRIKYAQEKLDQHQMNLLHEAILEELLAFDFSDPCYKEAIESLFKVAVKDEHLLVYNSLLCLYDFLELNEAGLEGREKELTKYRTVEWDIDPKAIVSVVRQKLSKNYNKEQSLFDKLEGTISERPIIELSIIDAISAVLTLHCILLMNDTKNVPKLLERLLFKFNEVIQDGKAFAKLFNSMMTLASSIHISKPTLINENSEPLPTQYIESINKLTRGYILFHSGNYNQSIELTTECLEIFKRHSLNLNCLITYDLIIQSFKAINDTVKQNEFMYERLCFVEDRKLSNKLIVNVLI